MPVPVISDATRVWDINVQWTLYSQCGVWNPRGKGVDIWECIRARKLYALRLTPSLADTVAPP